MAKHLTTDEQRAYLLKTLSEARIQASVIHLEGCAECRSALEVARKRLDVLDATWVEKAPDGLAERTIGFLASSDRRNSKSTPISRRRLALAAASVIMVIGITLLHRTFVREELNHGTMLSMKQLGLSFKMAANESDDGRWPALDLEGEGWTPDLDILSQLVKEHPYIIVSKNHPDFVDLEKEAVRALQLPSPDLERAAAIMSDNYAYLGYTMDDEAEFNAIRQAKEADELPAADESLPSSTAISDIHPLREGVERFLITDINNSAGTSTAQSTIPVLIEIATWKYKDSVEDFKGTNVLYMDGHVEFVKLGTFPVLPTILDALSGS